MKNRKLLRIIQGKVGIEFKLTQNAKLRFFTIVNCNPSVKKGLIIIIILIGTGCNRHPDLRCFAASTPTDLYIINTGKSEICVLIEANLFNGNVIQDEVCLSSQESKTLCYELENIPSQEITIKTNRKERKLRLSPTERNEIDYSTIEK